MQHIFRSLKGHLKISPLQVLFNPAFPFLSLLFIKVILPIANLAFPATTTL